MHFEEVKLEKSKDQYTVGELKRRADERVKEITSEVVIFTDGSTDGNQNKRGAGVFIHDRKMMSGKDSVTRQARFAPHTGLKESLLRALEWLDQKKVATTTICTDSLSLHKALANDDWKNAQDWLHKIKE